MAYQTGTAISQHNFLEDLKNFLQANGWTIDSFVAIGSGAGKMLHCHIGSRYINIRSADNENLGKGTFDGLAGYGSTGYNVGNAWNQQPGFCNTSGLASADLVFTDRFTQAVSYFFFLDTNNNFYAVIEYEVNQFQFIGSGEYTGTADSVVFFGMTADDVRTESEFNDRRMSIFSNYNASAIAERSTHIYFNTNWYSNPESNFYTNADNYKTSFGGYNQRITNSYMPSHCQIINSSSPNNFNGLSVMIPLYGMFFDVSKFRYIGYPENIRLINVEGIVEKSEIIIGSDTWVCFPARNKNNTFGFRGYAFKKIV